MGLFQNNSKPHTAEEYRKSAQAHLNAAKTMFLTFLKTGVIMVTGITVIIVLTFLVCFQYKRYRFTHQYLCQRWQKVFTCDKGK